MRQNNLTIPSPARQSLKTACAALLLALFFQSAGIASANRTEWKANSEARSRLLTPYGVEADGKSVWIGLELQLEPVPRDSRRQRSSSSRHTLVPLLSMWTSLRSVLPG